MHVDWPINDVKAQIIGRSVYQAPLNSATGQPHCKSLGMMVTPQAASEGRIILHHGCPAELAPPDNQSLVQQPAPLQVGDEPGDRPIAPGAEAGVVPFQVAMGVPLAPRAAVKLDEPDAPLDQAAGLDNGADAYLTKPVELDLLAATVRSVLRRRSGLTSGGKATPDSTWSLSADGWFLSTSDGVRVSLTRTERAFLQLLFGHAGQVVGRDFIIATLEKEGRGDDIDFDPHRIELLVHRLRKKTARLAGKPLPLNTVRGTGYALAAP